LVLDSSLPEQKFASSDALAGKNELPVDCWLGGLVLLAGLVEDLDEFLGQKEFKVGGVLLFEEALVGGDGNEALELLDEDLDHLEDASEVAEEGGVVGVEGEGEGGEEDGPGGGADGEEGVDGGGKGDGGRELLGGFGFLLDGHLVVGAFLLGEGGVEAVALLLLGVEVALVGEEEELLEREVEDVDVGGDELLDVGFNADDLGYELFKWSAFVPGLLLLVGEDGVAELLLEVLLTPRHLVAEHVHQHVADPLQLLGLLAAQHRHRVLLQGFHHLLVARALVLHASLVRVFLQQLELIQVVLVKWVQRLRVRLVSRFHACFSRVLVRPERLPSPAPAEERLLVRLR